MLRSLVRPRRPALRRRPVRTSMLRLARQPTTASEQSWLDSRSLACVTNAGFPLHVQLPDHPHLQCWPTYVHGGHAGGPDYESIVFPTVQTILYSPSQPSLELDAELLAATICGGCKVYCTVFWHRTANTVPVECRIPLGVVTICAHCTTDALSQHEDIASTSLTRPARLQRMII
jgi:hypothetical protein